MRAHLTVKPNSTKGPLIVQQTDGSLVVFIREIATDGQANEALVKLLAKYYNVPKTRVVIIRGHTSQHKVIEINL